MTSGSPQLHKPDPSKEAFPPPSEVLLTAMSEGVIYQDASGRVVFHNPGAARILGESVSESFSGAFQPTAEAAASGEHPAMAALRTASPCTGSILGVRRRGDAVTWISVNSVPLFVRAIRHPAG